MGCSRVGSHEILKSLKLVITNTIPQIVKGHLIMVCQSFKSLIDTVVDAKYGIVKQMRQEES